MSFLDPAWAGRNYRIQTAATVVSGLGNAAAPIATAFAVLHSGAGWGGTEVGYVALARTVPLVVLLLVGGAVADRLPRHLVMVGANLFNAGSQAVLAALVLCGQPSLWALVLLSAAGGAGQAFYAPAAEGVILQAVPPEHAAKAFSVFRMAMNGASIAGAALGGVLVAVVGPGWVLAADAACFAVAAALRVGLEASAVERGPARPGLVRELLVGWREFTARRWLWAIVAQFSVLNACVLAVEAVYGPVVAERRMGGAGAWGVAMAALSVGMVAAGPLMSRWQPRRLLLVGNGGVFLFGLPPLALALGWPLPLVAAAMFLAGVGTTVFLVGWMVALQQEVPEELLSRLSAYDSLGSFALLPLGTGLAGPAAAVFGLSGALWGCALVCAALAVLVLLVPEVRRLERAVPEASTRGREPESVTSG
ncbi:MULTISPECIES: MFS transporter [Kitasatospora]|uniref:Putative drug resistance protein n=1 Tax=Kitasatospora setae (strain ATCC 33774 / DSM 43861 / JCM 3304 / KCC A-0304 / NBRC 14216 / KM-6054) TaxID=452652 RepID=E4N321_KITSK|nr:MFS transporter [Kitasatospora setae]BAJ32555.1 putative drug resistance protein [Kitasatospora setae KM-6054]